MNKREKDSLYMDMAERVALSSYCERRKVGCLIVTKDENILIGYNGTVAGQPNVCEIELEGESITSPEVLHAETNALSKALKNGTSVKGATVYITLSPCLDCAKVLVQSGIREVIFKEEYRITTGIEFLLKCGIDVRKYEDCFSLTLRQQKENFLDD